MKKITFYVSHDAKQGDEEKQVLTEQVCVCRDSVLESNLAIVKKVAYNGKYAVDEVDDPEAPPTDAERIAELEEALALLLSGVVE